MSRITEWTHHDICSPAPFKRLPFAAKMIKDIIAGKILTSVCFANTVNNIKCWLVITWLVSGSNIRIPFSFNQKKRGGKRHVSLKFLVVSRFCSLALKRLRCFLCPSCSHHIRRCGVIWLPLNTPPTQIWEPKSKHGANQAWLVTGLIIWNTLSTMIPRSFWFCATLMWTHPLSPKFQGMYLLNKHIMLWFNWLRPGIQENFLCVRVLDNSYVIHF